MRFSIRSLTYITLLFYPFLTQAQENSNIELPKLITELNTGFKFSPNGQTFGIIADISKPLYINKSGIILLSSGLQEDIQVQMERGIEGTSGSTIRNSIHITLGPTFYLSKSGKFSSSIKIFGGWSYKSTNGKVDNAELNINRSYSDSYHYFSRGLFLQAAYEIKQDFFLSVFYKTDLRRLTDGDGILESPEMIYGIGFRHALRKE